MANIVFNRSLGRVTELCERVNANDPANAILTIRVLAVSGIESDATLKDKDTFADVVSGTTNEVTNSGYAAKTIDQTGGLTITYDDVNDRTEDDIPDQTWTAVAAGDNWSDVVFNYDNDSTTGTTANEVPMTMHDFVVTPDGSDITMQVATFFRAS